MKRFALIAMVMALVMAFAGAASAAELKAKGQVQAYGFATDNWDFEKSASRWDTRTYEDDFQIAERARLMLNFIANENLKAVVQLQIGNGFWGQSGFGLGQGDGATGLSTSLRVRQAYLDFNIPDTKVNVKAGYLTATLPNTYGSSILDDEVGALLVSAPIIEKTLSVLVGYTRLWDDSGRSGNNTRNAAAKAAGMRDEFDAALLALPFTMDGVSATPFFVYGWAGKGALDQAINTASSATSDAARVRGLLSPNPQFQSANPYTFQKDISAWWLGLNTKITMFDPIWAALNVNYGSLKGGGAVDGAAAPYDSKKVNDRSGYLIDFGIGYTGLDMVKPELFFAYTSGEDSDPTNGSERMPAISGLAKYTPFYFGGSAFGDGSIGDNVSGYRTEHLGFWTLGLALKKITFMEKLTHDFYFAYIAGTNSKNLLNDTNMITAAQTRDAAGVFPYQPGHFLTTKDSLFEFDFNTQYKIYEELTAMVELGYIVQSLNKDQWNAYLSSTVNGNADFKPSNAFKAMFGLSYDF